MNRLIAGLAALFVLAAPASAAVDKPAVEQAFQGWIAGDLARLAAAAGVSRPVYAKALAGVTLDWRLPELAPPGAPPAAAPEHQAEFRAPARYFNEAGLSSSATRGQALLAQWKPTLAAIEKRTGVPGPILIALWARESAFGAEALPYSAIRSLATEAFVGTRKDLFLRELVAALQIVQAGDISADAMKSSWAGALGQPQFLPSLFLRYAVDFDGDGRRDIWGSVPDTLASMANYLKSEGWDASRGWGVEVRLPATVACTLEGPDQGKPMKAWAAMGIVQADGRPLPGAASDRQAFLLMPAGRLGPAFVVSGNFYVLKAYNYSDLYALYVGHLADRLSENRPFAGAWAKTAPFTRDAVKAMQDRLVAAGYDVGKADGLIGYKTRIAAGLVQAKAGRPATCWPDDALLRGG